MRSATLYNEYMVITFWQLFCIRLRRSITVPGLIPLKASACFYKSSTLSVYDLLALACLFLSKYHVLSGIDVYLRN